MGSCGSFCTRITGLYLCKKCGNSFLHYLDPYMYVKYCPKCMNQELDLPEHLTINAKTYVDVVSKIEYVRNALRSYSQEKDSLCISTQADELMDVLRVLEEDLNPKQEKGFG